MLDLGTLFEKYSEISMMKDLFFDHNQSKLFEKLSKFVNVNKLYDYLSDDNNNEENEGHEDIFKAVKDLETRGSKNDKKLLEHLKLLFRVEL